MIQLTEIDPEDIEDVLFKIERSFDIQFTQPEMDAVKTFGELCDLITFKVQGRHVNDCTTQQAFYKIRQALHIDSLSLDTRLRDIFPRKNRRRHINTFESAIGFNTDIRHPKVWLTVSLALIMLASLGGFAYSWQLGAGMLIFSITGLFLTFKLGKVLDDITVRQLAEKIAREQYKKVRRDSSTINTVEIHQKIKELFLNDLHLDESALTKDAMLCA